MTEREREIYEKRRQELRRRRKRRRRIQRMMARIICLLIVVLLIVLCIFLLGRKGNDAGNGTDNPSVTGSLSKAPDKPTDTPTPTPSPSPTPSPTPNVVSMVAVGDNLYDWYMLEDGYQGDGTFDFTGWYDPVKPYVEMADFAVVNQETPLGGDGGYIGSGVEYDYIGSNKRWGSYHGYSTFNTPDEVAKELMKTGFNVITMATNHASDHGYKALARSVQYWREQENITLLGIHDSEEDRDNIRVVEKYGIRLALLNYTYGVNIGSATKEAPYSIDILSQTRVKNDVAKAKEISDFVVVFVHWGTEYEMSTNAYQKDYTKLFLNCGVDAVIGAHPHISQPMEWLTSDTGHRMVVYYSLGNFLSMFKNAKCQLEGMAYLEFYKDGEEKYIKEGTIIPLVNHWNYDSSVLGKRKNFTVYALQDYSTTLAGEHGCRQFRDGAGFDYELMQKLAKQLWGDHIKTVEFAKTEE